MPVGCSEPSERKMKQHDVGVSMSKNKIATMVLQVCEMQHVNSQHETVVKNEGINRAARIAEINLTGPFMSISVTSIFLCFTIWIDSY